MTVERKSLLAVASAFLTLSAGSSVAYAQDTKIRWDIISAQFGGGACDPVCISAGGFASAYALDPRGNYRLKITLTGSGTFSPFDPTDVTGGGDFTIRDESQTNVVASGKYTVTGLVSFVVDSAQPAVAINRITNTPGTDFRNGLAVLRIAYSDGSKGILIVSCAGPGVVDPNIYEGVSITKGAVHFAVPETPISASVDANRTIFIVIPR